MATVVQQLRIRSPERDTHAVAARVEAQLNAAELAPAALPPGARLVVRRLGGGLPPWRMDPRSVRPPAEWQAAVLNRLDGLLRRAVRARRGVIPEDAEAILFLDDAEMVSQMALDWMGGTLHSRWCWRTLFPRGDLIDTLLRAWMERPECVPSAVERLAEARRAATFVQRLPEPVLKSLAQSLIRVFVLRHLAPVFEAVFHGSSPTVPEIAAPLAQAGQAAAPRTEVAADELPSSSVSAPHIPPQPEVQSTPEIRRTFFLELAVGLQCAPRMVRSREWAAGLHARLAAPSRPELLPPSKAIASEQTERAVKQPAAPVEEFVRFAQNTPAPARQPMEKESASELTPQNSGQIAQTRPEPPPTPAPSPDADPEEGTGIHTEFGGIFYLINLAIYLGYYGDFSTPDEPGIDLLLWDFLAQTGRELAGKRLLEDPVWPFLERLATGEPWDQFDEAMPRIREWLAEALGPREDPAAFVLEHAARVRLTDTRLVFFLSLEALPIEIRIARLDRDPGWVPAAGRFIAFHFL